MCAIREALRADASQLETSTRRHFPHWRFVYPLICVSVSLFGQSSDAGPDEPRPEAVAPCLTVLPNLDGWYDFEGSTNPTSGVGGLGPDAVWFGAPSPIPGLQGTGLRFDGSSFLEVTNSTAFNYPTQGFSVALWVRTTATSAVFLDKRCIGTAGGCGLSPQGWALGISPNGNLQFLMGSALPYFYEGFAANTLGRINDGEWHFVSISVDRQGQKLTLAVDGGQQPISLEGYVGAIPSVRPLRIGGDQISQRKFAGDLDEIQLYGRPITVQEMVNLANAGPGGQCRPPVCSPVSTRRSLLGWYGFEETSGIVWQDRAGQNNYLSGTVEQIVGQTGFAAQFARVQAGGGLRTFDGALELDMGTGNFTVAAWIRYFPAQAALRRAIIDKHGDDSTGGGYSLLLDEGYLRLAIAPAGAPRGAASSWVANRTRLDDGRWHHVAAIVDRANAQPALYVDGQPETHGPGRGSMPLGSVNSRSPLNVGGFASEMSDTFGAIDELSIFNSVLTPGEVQSIFDAAGTGYCRRNDQGCIAPPVGMLSWYRFENATGAFDDAGVVPNEPMVVTGNITRATGRVGRGVRLSEGASSLRTLGATPKLNFDAGAFSFSFWIQPGSASGGTAPLSRTLIEKMTYTSPPNTVRATQGYRVRMVSGRLELALASGGNLAIWTGSAALRANQWSIITITIPRGVDASPGIYVNGRAESLSAAGVVPVGSLMSPSPVLIGTSADTSLNPAEPTAFDFDELSFYSRLLSSAEVQALAASTAGQCFDGQVPPVKPVFEVGTNPAGIGIIVGVSGDSSALNNYATTIAPAAVTASAAVIPSSVNGTEFRFRDWSLNGVPNPDWNSIVQFVPLPVSASTYTANYEAYHRLAVTVTGNCTVTPAAGSYLSGATRALSVKLPTGWVLASATFTSPNGSRPVFDNTPLTITGPSSLTVVCQDGTNYPVSVSTFPPNVGLQVIADGNQVSSSQSFSWTTTPARILNVASPVQVVGLTQFTFDRWRNASTNTILASAPVGQVVVLPSAPTAYVAEFSPTGYQLLVKQPQGCLISVSPAPGFNGFYPPGTRLTVTNTASSGYLAGPLTFQGLSASSLITRNSPADWQLDSPLTITGQCSPQVTAVRLISSPAPAEVAISFFSSRSGIVTQAKGRGVVSLQVSPGTLTFTAAPFTDGTDGAIRRFIDITPGNVPNGGSVASPSINTTYTANYDVQCYSVTSGYEPANSGSLSVTLLSGERPYVGSDCFSPGSVLSINAFPRPGYQFLNWNGDLAGSPSQTQVIVYKPISVSAIFRPIP